MADDERSTDESVYEVEVTEENRGEVQRTLNVFLHNGGRTESGIPLRELVLKGRASDTETALVAKILGSTVPRTTGDTNLQGGISCLMIEGGVTAQGVQVLASSLQSAFGLQELFLPQNPIGPAGLETLLRAIYQAEQTWHGCRLHTLVLERCGFGDESMAVLAQCFPASVDHLYLDDNDVSDQGALCLVSSLRKRANTTPIHIFLNDNKIGDVGVAALLALQQEQPSIYDFKLDGNPTTLVPSGDPVLVPGIPPPLESTGDDEEQPAESSKAGTASKGHVEEAQPSHTRTRTPRKDALATPRSVFRNTPTRSRSGVSVVVGARQPRALLFDAESTHGRLETPGDGSSTSRGFHFPSFLIGVCVALTAASASVILVHKHHPELLQTLLDSISLLASHSTNE